ncbi:MAG: diguanylate cyclase [Candidatus Dormibacteria bacterium]
MTSAWLRQALLRDRLSVAAQADACFRAVAALIVAVTALGAAVVISLLADARVLTVLLGLFLLVAVVGLIVVGRFTRRVVREIAIAPIAEMAATARRVASGDLGAVGQPYGPLEWQQVTSAVGGLADSLARERTSRAADLSAGQTRTMTLHQLLRVIQRVGASLELEDVTLRLAEGMSEVGGFRRAVVWLRDEDDRLIPARHLGEGDAPVPTAGDSGPVRRAVVTAQTVPIRTEGDASGLAIPLVRGLEAVGAVELCGAARPVGLETLDALETLASFGCSSIAAAQLHEEVELRSETDGLTKVFNRRKLDIDLKAEVARSARYQRPLSLIMIDVDHFKGINDSFGHQQGDEVLKAVAAIIGRRSRETDSAYRYGGEEFAILLRETPLWAAAEIAERMRLRIREGLAALGLPRDITASLGVAAVDKPIMGADQLVEAADGALYSAKEAGRNRVVVSPRLMAGGSPGGPPPAPPVRPQI